MAKVDLIDHVFACRRFKHSGMGREANGEWFFSGVLGCRGKASAGHCCDQTGGGCRGEK